MGQRTSPIPHSPTKAVEQVERPVLEQPCGDGEKDRQRDLCAQWKAADAASEAAYWAKLSFILGAIGTVGLFITLYYTRAAVRVANEATKDADTAIAIATRNADAAADLVEVSRINAEAQTRAYLEITSVSMLWYGGQIPTIEVKIANTGQSPAGELSLLWRLLPEGVPQEKVASPEGFTSWVGVTGIEVGAKQTASLPEFPCKEILPYESNFIIMQVILGYQDVFGRKQATRGSFTAQWDRTGMGEVEMPPARGFIAAVAAERARRSLDQKQ